MLLDVLCDPVSTQADDSKVCCVDGLYYTLKYWGAGYSQQHDRTLITCSHTSGKVDGCMTS